MTFSTSSLTIWQFVGLGILVTIGIYIVARLFSKAIFQSYFEAKHRYESLKEVWDQKKKRKE